MKKFLISLLVVLAAVVGGNVAAPGNTTAQAAASKWGYIKNTPKKLRGTWYHKYSKREGGMDRLIVKKHKVTLGLKSPFTFKSLTISKMAQKGKFTTYGFNSKTEPSDASSFFNYTKKINGKKRHVLVLMPQGTGIRPAAYTHFKPKHTYTVSTSVLKRTPDPISR